jgi:hypothetical protein
MLPRSAKPVAQVWIGKFGSESLLGPTKAELQIPLRYARRDDSLGRECTAKGGCATQRQRPTLKNDPSQAPFDSPFETQSKQGKRVGHPKKQRQKQMQIPRRLCS